MSSKFGGLFVRLILFAIFVFGLLGLFNKDSKDPSLGQQLDSADMKTLATPSIHDQVRMLEKELPEIDFSYWYRYAKPDNYRMNGSCAHYPDPLDLQLHNFYWQTFINANVTFRLYAAYLDKRPAVNSSRGVVRILATANQIGNEFPLTHCQLWYKGHKEPFITPISEYISVWILEWSLAPLLSYPHVLSCPIPDELPVNLEGSTPRTVSLTTHFCEDASNSLRVNYEAPKNSISNPSRRNSSKAMLNFGVCLKAFEFPFVDISQRLIEWFELQRLLGASRIYAYVYNVHPAVQRTLDYYQHSGFLELRPLTMANGVPRLPHYLHLLINNRLLVKRLNELIPYNDCFYRNMYKHDYMINVDIDEVIMPLGELYGWQDVLDADQQNTKFSCPNGFGSLCLIHSHFPINFGPPNPDELFMLQYTMRLRNYTQENIATKCFHNTRYSLTLHNHYTLKMLPGACIRRFLSTQLAHMQHYRNNSETFNASELVEDRSTWKFATELRRSVKYVLMYLDDRQRSEGLAGEIKRLVT